MTRADVTAVTVWQATLPVPGRVIPSEPYARGGDPGRRAHLRGDRLRRLPRAGAAAVELGLVLYRAQPVQPARQPAGRRGADDEGQPQRRTLPGPRLRDDRNGITWVPAYTDMKLHDITSGPDDPNRETLNMHFAPGSDEFFAGNCRFLTKRLWGVGNTAPYFHHGKFTTMRQAILAHAGEAQAQARRLPRPVRL